MSTRDERLMVAWTGHRPDLFRYPATARAVVGAIARELLATDGPGVEFVLGGQRGVDTWAALAAQAIGVPYTVILPVAPEEFVDAAWSADDRHQLQAILTDAIDVRIIGGEPGPAFSARNQALVDAADLLVAVWTATGGGGTAETITLARASGVKLREAVLEAAPAAAVAVGRGV